MSFEEMVVALVGAIGAFALVGYLSAKTFGLIRAWIDRNKSGYDDEAFDRLAKAFIEHKKNTERRIQNLEAIIADSEEKSDTSKPQKLEEPKHSSIEIDDQKADSNTENNNLKNMLRE